MTPPVAGADLRAALVANCFLGAFPPVDLRAVCLVLAILSELWVVLLVVEKDVNRFGGGDDCNKLVRPGQNQK